jgi:hypothetical protein
MGAFSAMGRPAMTTQGRFGTWPTIAIRGGGHSYAGFGVADGALQVDLGAFTTVTVDQGRRVPAPRHGTECDFVLRMGPVRGPRTVGAIGGGVRNGPASMGAPRLRELHPAQPTGTDPGNLWGELSSAGEDQGAVRFREPVSLESKYLA